MIICDYSELKQYQLILPKLDKALSCVEKLRSEGFSAGRYEYDGGFVLVQHGRTKPYVLSDYEAHKKFIDVQYIVQGSEVVYYAPLTALKIHKDYDSENDVTFYSKSGNKGSVVQINEGMCWIAHPFDGHMPCRHENDSTNYVKAVIKFSLSPTPSF